MKTCVITGGASGIGEALMHRFGDEGYAVIGLDVDHWRAQEVQEALERKGVRAGFIQCDLQKVEHVPELVAQLPEGLDMVIHSAGISAVGPFGKLDLNAQWRVLDINLHAPIALTRELLVQKKLAKRGELVFISSLSRFVGYPGASVYAASKDGLASYARSLRMALAPEGKRVITVYPGPTRTPHARRYSPDNSREQRRMPPEAVAQAVWQAHRWGHNTVIPGMTNQLFAALGLALPSVSESLLRRLMFKS